MLPRHLIENIMLQYAGICGENKVPHLTRVCKEWRLFLVKLMTEWHRYLYALRYQTDTNEEHSWRSQLLPILSSQSINLDFLVALLVHGDPAKHALVWSQEQYPFRSNYGAPEVLLRYPHTTNYLLFSKLEIGIVVHCAHYRIDLLQYLYQNSVRVEVALESVANKYVSIPLLHFLMRVKNNLIPKRTTQDSSYLRAKIFYSALMFEECDDVTERGVYREMIGKFFK